ncbi:MAG: DUF1846 domain-containing protein [Christensenellales bacterium]|jgi:uncharacterized protein (UPF0371 family)
MKIGFDAELYAQKQTEKILERIAMFDNKLYLEFGGKLFDDYHAARVLPGFDVNGKVKILLTLKDQCEIIFCISASDIEQNRIRADFGITYDQDMLRLIDHLREWGLQVTAVVITQYQGQHSADLFKNKLEGLGMRTYIHTFTKGYPTDVDTIVSDEGYGKSPYVETSRPLVIVTAPGPGSGKLATCLSQLYHEYKRGVKAGYAKFETFPIWNIPLKHPVNLAYEAATADLHDINVIDHFHLEAYGVSAVNYNRDIAAFPIVKNILHKITGNGYFYNSPTDMGVNMAGYAIVDDAVCCEAAKQEVIRRYFRAKCDQRIGRGDAATTQTNHLLLKELDIWPHDRPVVTPALEKAAAANTPAMAIALPDGTILTGKSSRLMNAPAAMLINAIKYLSGIPDDMHLISPVVLAPILRLKGVTLGERDAALSPEEALIALSISAATNPMVETALEKLPALAGCDAHSTVILSETDERLLRKLRIEVTCEAVYASSHLYQNP